MKKISILILAISMALMLALTPKAHAYTLGNTSYYYNRVTGNLGHADVLDLTSNSIEYMYYYLASSNLEAWQTVRVVFSNAITTELLPLINPNSIEAFQVVISFYDTSNILIETISSYYPTQTSLSYFENNFRPSQTINNLDYITISLNNINGWTIEDDLHQVMNSVIISYGQGQIIYNPINNTQYEQGWSDAMNSKVTQIWSLWGNIFDTFMSVFDIFSIQLMGDITIGHIAMVPLVLGLIGFIYALGGKRGR